MSNNVPINETLPQAILYRQGKRSLAKKIRKENPELTRRASREAASAIAVENKPNQIRRMGAKRLGRAAGAIALATGAVAGAGALVEQTQARVLDTARTDLTEGAPGTEELTIQVGDTLYGIANERTNGDPRALVDRLAEQPDALDGLQPGDQLIVPKVDPSE